MNKRQINELKRRALSVLFPNICPFCGRVINARQYHCEKCAELLPIIHSKLPPPENISALYAYCWYSGIARKAVHMLKFRHLIYPADAFGLMMSRMLRNVKADAIVPVPSGIKSMEKRGFAPAEVIAERISMRLFIPVKKALRAEFDKAEQKNLTRKARVSNAKKSFYHDPKVDVRGQRLLLVDDVTTTGSTLSVLGGILLAAGAADVAAAVFAKVPDGIIKSDKPKLFRRK